jgi:hypothetical protein
MDSIRNKPKVFLSHSNTDKDFIQKIDEDLRKCLIDPWIDSRDIRHGESWLDAIFESGIPTCDCVLIYLTEASIQSPMVKKEIDASVLQKLKDKHVGFLPYVSDASLRNRLRHDIQSIQAPEWNDKNYDQLLPRVVAEIWRYYFDRKINEATLEEKNRRLQLELELENIKRKESEGIFSKSEQKDFNFIWNKFDRLERVSFSRAEKKSQKILDENFCEIEINIQPILSIISFFSGFGFNKFVSYKLLRIIIGEIFPEEDKNLKAYNLLISSEELLKFGLLVITSKTEGSFSDNKVYTRNINTPSDKMRRFEYWLDYTGKMPKELKYRLFQKNQDPIESTCSIENIIKKL